ncbi:MAG: ABC transporter permease [Calditrichaeota bacterium]|nr:MAG: ABC transporter permease [Calditrichota bacterium]
MRLLVTYSFKSIFQKKLTSLLTVFGFALVVFVFSAVLMLSNGLEQTLVDTGSDSNVVVIRKGSQTEVQSIIYRSMANDIKAEPEIKKDEAGVPLVTGEILVLINQPKRADNEPSNVPVRGVSPMSIQIRPEFNLVEGRMWQPGTSEIIAGRKVADNFKGCGLGETVKFGMRDWTVVGIFETGGGGFESELWGDVDQLMDAFGRPVFSSLTFTLDENADFDALKDKMESDPKLTVDVDMEKEYYRKQSTLMTTFINILGITISIIFFLGAIVGAMITMYASVANRTVEIGTLRALGFRRYVVLLSFLLESILISLIGGTLGVAVAFLLNSFEFSTTNWATFAELAFSFRMSPDIVVQAYIFAVVMGILGGFLPAVRASRLRIINALRAK